MSVMVQVSPRDAAGTLYNIKSEADEAEVTWADFGQILNLIGGADLARKVRDTIATILSTGAAPVAPPAPADPLAAAYGVVQGAFPNAAPVQAPAAAAQVPGVAIPPCQHGARKIVRSKPGSAKTWVAVGCPAGQNDPTKCNPGLDFDLARDLGL